jgi:hypothetical protein
MKNMSESPPDTLPVLANKPADRPGETWLKLDTQGWIERPFFSISL